MNKTEQQGALRIVGTILMALATCTVAGIIGHALGGDSGKWIAISLVVLVYGGFMWLLSHDRFWRRGDRN